MGDTDKTLFAGFAAMKAQTIADLFDAKPNHWGLRGDAYLWDELQAYFSDMPLPDSTEELEELVGEAFEILTNHTMNDEKSFFIDKLAKDTPVSGGVLPNFWRERIVPLLKIRYQHALIEC